MNSTTYHQLTIFLAIAKEGSINAAARKLGITSPSVSQALKQLEETLALPLFWRNTRRIQLTEAGSHLKNQIEHLMHDLDTRLDGFIGSEQKPAGIVRITLSRFAYRLILEPRLAEFHRSYPHICLDISVYDGTIDLVQAGYDLGIRFGDKIDENMVARPLLAGFAEGLYVSQGYLDRHGTPTWENLHQHRLIGYRFVSSGQILPLILNHNGQTISRDLPTSLICNDIDTTADAIRAGLGIGRLFTPIYEQLTDKARLIPVLKPHWRHYPKVYLYYPQMSQKIKRVQAVIDFLTQKCNEKM